MTAEDGREAVIAFTEESAAILGDRGWKPQHAATTNACSLPGGGKGASYGWDLLSPLGTDPEGDTRKLAAHWNSLGMTTRIVEQGGEWSIYATGGPVLRASFHTGGIVFSIGATAHCSPGDSGDINSTDADARDRGEVLPGDADSYYFDEYDQQRETGTNSPAP